MFLSKDLLIYLSTTVTAVLPWTQTPSPRCCFQCWPHPHDNRGYTADSLYYCQYHTHAGLYCECMLWHSEIRSQNFVSFILLNSLCYAIDRWHPPRWDLERLMTPPRELPHLQHGFGHSSSTETRLMQCWDHCQPISQSRSMLPSVCKINILGFVFL